MRFKITIQDANGYQAPYIRETRVTTEKGKRAWMKRMVRQIMGMDTVRGVEIEVVD